MYEDNEWDEKKNIYIYISYQYGRILLRFFFSTKALHLPCLWVLVYQHVAFYFHLPEFILETEWKIHPISNNDPVRYTSYYYCRCVRVTYHEYLL